MQQTEHDDVVSRLLESDISTESDSTELKFADLFDLAEIQEIQDAFSKATGVASIITQIDGTPITRPSRFCTFCNEIVRKTPKGLENCMYSDSILGSPKKDGPRMQRCLSGGLMDGGASIMVGETHIASWLIGQVLEHEPDIEMILAYVDEIGADREQARLALNQVARLTNDQFKAVCDFLFIMARQLSELAMKNLVQAREIAKRRRYELEIKQINENLERIVQQRTAELSEMNAHLEEKISQRTDWLSDINAVLENEIKARIEVEKSLRASERVLYESQKVAHIGSYVMDYAKGIWKSSPELGRIFGVDSESLRSLNDWLRIVKPEFRKRVHNLFYKEQGNQNRYELEYMIVRQSDGMERWVHHICEYNRDKDIEQTQIIGTVQDITEYKKTENRILHLSYHDNLTNLHNRRYYEEAIKRLDIEKNLPITIVMGDVNGLKMINDAFGHALGDELLKKASHVIQSICHQCASIARWGGDEFVILLPKTTSDEAEQIVGQMRKRATGVQVCDIPLSISYGWATKETPDVNIIQVLKRAEDLMYKNKVIEKKGMRGNTITTILNALHEKSPREELHSTRVSKLCRSIGHAMQFSESSIGMLQTAGMLHDIGKIAIHEGILNKPDRLSAREWDQMRRHPDIGYRILGSSHDMIELAECILAHHERWDGMGYPKGLKGAEIPIEARIIAIADTFDAMTSNRPYQQALSREVALAEILRCSGTQFDPDLVRVFVDKVTVE